MSQPSQRIRPCGPILHTAPDPYVLACYQPTQGQPDYCRVACESFDPDQPEKGDGLSINLSLFDAHLAAALLSGPGTQYHAIHASEFDPRELIRDSGGELHYFSHRDWAESNGKLVIRRNGGLVAFCGLDTLQVPLENQERK